MSGNRRPKVDNSLIDVKSNMRTRFLPEKARVLDLFCGGGEMYRQVYNGNVEAYHGVDKAKIHDSSMCTLDDNVAWIKTHGVGGYNVFDLDDYGSPWELIFLLMTRMTEPEITMFITDGTFSRMRLSGIPSKIISATSMIPMGMVIPGFSRWYMDCLKTMLASAADRSGYKVVFLVACDNRLKDPSRTSVFYLVVKLERLTNS